MTQTAIQSDRVVSLRNVAYAYPGGPPAVQRVSLELRAGERVAALGPNGAGKTTLAWILSGLIWGDGEGDICGLPVGKPNLPAIRRRVGLLFQNPEDQLFCPTLLEDVAFGPMRRGLTRPEAEEAARRALAEVDLPGLENRSPQRLSLGQKKRAALAGVMAMDCEMLVLDEPADGLDPRGRRELIEAILRRPKTLLMVTHDLDMARRLCDRAVILAGGRIVADGPIEDILSNASLLSENHLV